MPRHQAFVLHIWHSTTANGRQWSARLDAFGGGPSPRFTDPEALLAHLRTVVYLGDSPAPTLGAEPETGRATDEP